MKVEIWSDLICPWCGLGQHRLERAIAQFAHRDHVEVVHRSFQLDANAPTTPEPARDMLRKKYRMSEPQLVAAFERVEGLAAADGLTPYIVGENRVGNTRLAHELLAMAAAHGQAPAAWQHLYRAYFGAARSIFDVDSLVELGGELGLPAGDVRDALERGTYRAQVDADLAEARSLGCTGVPFVVIDRRVGVAGAQPIETFHEALAQAWHEQPTPLATASDVACGPDGCAG